MEETLTRRCFALTLCALLSSSAAFADGDGPTRAMSVPESQAFKSLGNAIREALPKPPSNYSVAYSGFDKKEVPEGMTPDRMAHMSFSAEYTLKQEARDSRQKAAVMDMAKGTPEQQKRIAALDAKEESLSKARKATRDRAEKERIRVELNAVRDEKESLNKEIMAKYFEWVQSGGMQKTVQNVDGALPAKEIWIRLRVNEDFFVKDDAKPYAVAGTPLAFEERANCDGYPDKCCVTVLLGSFDREKRTGTTRYTPQNANVGASTKARGMALVFFGPKDKPETVRDFVRKTNLARLKAQLP